MGDWERADAPCPQRGAGLSHTQDTQLYKTGHCAYCKVRILFPVERTEPVQPELPPEPFDVAERMRKLGILPSSPADETLSPDCIVDHASMLHGTACGQCGIIHEMRAISDLGPQGDPNGKGRGGLTPRYKAKLGFLLWDYERKEP